MSSTNINPSDTVSFVVLSNGTAVQDSYQITSIDIDKAVNHISSCKLVIADGDPAKEEWPASESPHFVPGAAIEVKAGYGSNDQTIFKGLVVSQGLRVNQSIGQHLEVICKDEAVKMCVGRKNATYQNKKDSEVWSDIIGQYSGLGSSVADTQDELPEIVQYYVSDWDFLLSRAEFNSMVVINSDNEINVANPNNESTEALSVTYGEDIFEFNADLDSLSQLGNVKTESWDFKTQSVISGQAQATDDSQGNLTTGTLSEVVGLKDYLLQSTSPLDSASLNTWAKAQATKSKFAKIRGTMTLQGNAEATPGKLIDINGMGTRFDGKAYMSAINHSISAGNWITEVSMGLSPEWFTEQVWVEAPVASGMLPGIQGLQNGIVKKIYDDPDSEYRVLVDVPIIDPDGQGIWARLSTFYAGNSAGAFFYPEIGDEVILGFLNNDPRHPVILGSVYSSGKHQPSFSPNEENGIKGLVTRGELKLTFDDENKVLTISTPDQNQIVLSDQDKSIIIRDKNENSIVMSSSGINISTPSNLELKAGQQVTINGEMGLNLQSHSGDLSLQGVNVKADADVQLKLSGSATASLSAGAETTIQGAMVMIN